MNRLETSNVSARFQKSEPRIIFGKNLFSKVEYYLYYLHMSYISTFNIFVFVFQTQDIAIRCIQKNVRKFMGVREWPWWRLLIKITPMLNVHRTENQLKSQTVRRGLKESCCNSAHNTYLLILGPSKVPFFLCVKIICLDVSKLLKDSVFL